MDRQTDIHTDRQRREKESQGEDKQIGSLRWVDQTKYHNILEQFLQLCDAFMEVGSTDGRASRAISFWRAYVLDILQLIPNLYMHGHIFLAKWTFCVAWIQRMADVSGSMAVIRRDLHCSYWLVNTTSLIGLRRMEMLYLSPTCCKGSCPRPNPQSC